MLAMVNTVPARLQTILEGKDVTEYCFQHKSYPVSLYNWCPTAVMGLVSGIKF